MTEAQVRSLLKKRIGEYTLKKVAAEDIGVSQAHLYAVLKGKKPGTKILNFLGLRQVRFPPKTVYEAKK